MPATQTTAIHTATTYAVQHGIAAGDYVVTGTMEQHPDEVIFDLFQIVEIDDDGVTATVRLVSGQTGDGTVTLSDDGVSVWASEDLDAARDDYMGRIAAFSARHSS